MRLKRSDARSIVILLIELLVIIVFLLIPTSNTTESVLSSIGGMALICMIASTIAIYLITRKINFVLCFVILSYLFSFAQSMLIFCGKVLPVSAFSISYSGFRTQDLRGSAVFNLISICLLCLGYCFVPRRKIEWATGRPMFENEDRVKDIGWFLFIISLIPTFYLLYLDIIGTLSIGYGSTLGNYSGIAKLCQLISGFFISGILMILCFETRKSRRNVMFLVLIIYCGLQLAGGSRISVFRLGVVILILFNILYKSITKKRAVVIALLVFALAFVFSTVSSARIYLYSANDIRQFLGNTAKDVWENNFLESSLREVGNTQILNTLVYANCPKPMGYQFGLSFIKMIWGILPNLIGSAYTGYIGVDITFSPLYMKTSAGLGGSYLAEGYWNFGYLSVIYFCIIGYFLGRVENRFTEMCNAKSRKATSLFLEVYIMYYMIFLVRSEMLGFGRSFVYYALLPVLLCNARIHRKNHSRTGDRI